jgi:hypothetical protein
MSPMFAGDERQPGNPASTAVSTGALVDRAGTAITVGAPSLRRRHRSFHNNSNASGGGAASKHVLARDNDVVAVMPVVVAVQ